MRTFPGRARPDCSLFRCVVVRKVEESTKSPATTAATVVPPAPAEERVKKREVEDIKVEDTKRNEDAMDVEQTHVRPLLTKHTNEHPPDQPTSTSTDGKETEDVSHAP